MLLVEVVDRQAGRIEDRVERLPEGDLVQLDFDLRIAPFLVEPLAVIDQLIAGLRGHLGHRFGKEHLAAERDEGRLRGRFDFGLLQGIADAGQPVADLGWRARRQARQVQEDVWPQGDQLLLGRLALRLLVAVELLDECGHLLAQLRIHGGRSSWSSRGRLLARRLFRWLGFRLAQQQARDEHDFRQHRRCSLRLGPRPLAFILWYVPSARICFTQES